MSLQNLRHRRGILLCCCASIALVSPVLAQDAAGTRLSPVIRLPEITLEAAGTDDDATSIVAQEMAVGGKVATSILDTPASVSVITRAEIERRDARTLEDVLQYSAGTITDYYGTDDRNDYFLLRGFQASTYRDGITLGSMRGIREEPLAYDRVEVIRGANSTLFGVADPGGSVNFVTKRPRAERLRDFSATVGSHDRKELGFDVGDVLTPDATLSWRLTGRVKDAAREYDFSRDDAGFLMGGLTWQPSDVTSVSLIVDRLTQDATPNSGGYPRGGDYDRGLFLGEPEFNYLDVARNTATVIVEHDLGGGLTLRSNLRGSNTSDDYGYVYIAGEDGSFPVGRGYIATDGNAEERAGNVILQYDRQLGRIDSSTLAGLEYRDVTSRQTSYFAAATPIDPRDPVYSGRPDSLVPYLDRRGSTTNKAIFAQQNLSLDDRYILTLGARHDRLDLREESFIAGTDSRDDFAETSLRAALTWKATPELSAYASYAESVAPPAIGIEPERGDQYELGVKYAPLGMNALFSAALYDLRKTNITVVNTDTFDRELVGEIRVRGLDLEAKAELTPEVTLTASYSYTDSEVLRSDPVFGIDVTGNEMGSVPNHAASLWVDYRLAGAGARGDMTFGLGARYTGSYFYNTQNNNGRSEAALLLDAAYSYDITESAQLSLNVHNLTDEKHVVGRGSADYYNPGREIALTLRSRF
ncbi:TonB-dependent siderophore receptor [Paracoccus tibetensis]|uniref:Iron complex outermembrane recepter protein n=1 Tax=Paracoccus tibetensis TaxID=336292 RepID=A0A1G5D0C5_9RHOB|nr:TonB-dependent siderophore receptor [Paracoccus tibetensis]SCY07910.1 iron complex outermembrane recepter protein [Paracoccus tibetensis]